MKRDFTLLLVIASLALLVLMLLGCATPSQPTPCPAPVIPAPPVTLGPQHSVTFQPSVSDWQSELLRFSETARQRMMNGQQK